MNETYYEFGTAADRWDRAQMFFEAKEYLTAARILGRARRGGAGSRAAAVGRGGRRLPATAPPGPGRRRRSSRAVLELDPVESYARLDAGPDPWSARGGRPRRPRNCGRPPRSKATSRHGSWRTLIRRQGRTDPVRALSSRPAGTTHPIMSCPRTKGCGNAQIQGRGTLRRAGVGLLTAGAGGRADRLGGGGRVRLLRRRPGRRRPRRRSSSPGAPAVHGWTSSPCALRASAAPHGSGSPWAPPPIPARTSASVRLPA
ncbi:hypothetical protein SMICM304S_08578 [Streptomyces microflavus]